MAERSHPGDGPLRIGNCSGFYGDRLTAMREQLEGGHLDVLTGDYLAELTMLILGRDRLKDPALGYARTFLTQLGDCLELALARGVRIVANAGGLNPAGLAAAVESLGTRARVAYVDGDDLTARADELGFAGALTANAYLGGFGIATALGEDADVVVTGRVTDAALVTGPAAWWHGWTPGDLDALAGAVVAGHVLECGTQATGGNFSGFATLPPDDRPLGFPVAEVADDGSSVITKHAGTGGRVSVDTVTAQLFYEIGDRHYLGPDVTVDLGSVRLEEIGPDRVRVSGVRGLAPPARLKVGVNALGGYRNQVELVLTGLDVPAKAAWVHDQLEARMRTVGRPESVEWSLGRPPQPDADDEEAASTLLRCTVRDPAADRVGRGFTGAAVELALASYPGFTMTAPPGRPSPYGVFTAAYVERADVTEKVHLAGGEVREVEAGPALASPAIAFPDPPLPDAPLDRSTRRVPFGAVVYARSGDKGGDANLGLWVPQGQRRDARVAWLLGFVTEERTRTLVPEARGLDLRIVPLANLGGVNVVIHGLLGQGVAASSRFDPQAKGLGEWVRSRLVDVPEELLDPGGAPR